MLREEQQKLVLLNAEKADPTLIIREVESLKREEQELTLLL